MNNSSLDPWKLGYSRGLSGGKLRFNRIEGAFLSGFKTGKKERLARQEMIKLIERR